MCGLRAKIGPRDSLRWRSRDVLNHRGPDGYGRWLSAGEESSDPVEVVELEHWRLAIRDLSAAGAQPMTDDDGVLIYNGELYNCDELIAELGYPELRSRSDTEVLLKALGAWGTGAAARLRGMFAFVYWDRRRDRLIAARDRVGLKPLYYLEHRGAFAACSEIKGLLDAANFHPELDYQALDQYLAYLYIPAPRTIYRGIHELTPGHLIVRDRRGLRLERFWELRFTPRSRPRREVVAELRERIVDAVSARLVADVPMGAFLSGGLDSATIVAAARAYGTRLSTFTVGFGASDRALDESAAAAAVARALGARNHQIRVDADCAAGVDQMIVGFDQPFGNPTALLSYALARAVRPHVKVVLSGDGGDEALGGYPRYRALHWIERFGRSRRWIPPQLADWIPAADRTARRRLSELLATAQMAPEDAYCEWVGYFNALERRALYTPGLLASLGAPEQHDYLKSLFVRAREVGAASLAQAAFYVDLHSFLPSNVLAYCDRMSMAHGLEVRAPLTDHRLLEFVAGIPASIDRHAGKRLLKESVRDALPRWMLRQSKRGFNPPLARWLKHELREMLESWLSSSQVRRRGLFQVERVEALKRDHLGGRGDLSHQLWALMVLERWMQLTNDRTAARSLPLASSSASQEAQLQA
ncbi:MAG TPA: asparagine synthase (glutamine-hydrolyzing) [Candidatus Binataceae bacterium]|nr:asparagine synthase (glutamine-hydrolyzing) [Candidatus Binataceae bacterium]